MIHFDNFHFKIKMINDVWQKSRDHIYVKPKNRKTLFICSFCCNVQGAFTFPSEIMYAYAVHTAYGKNAKLHFIELIIQSVL